jgi:phenylpropionate dioxygenase-like ring-hydroxylating dioxygenase large terminal subunit
MNVCIGEAMRDDRLRRAWLPALPLSRLASGAVRVDLGERSLAVFRDGAGRARAVLDRCPHRGARLSLGRVTGGQLACPYHGWTFDGDGRCVAIPSLADGAEVPEGCRVPAVPCREADGYAWVWLDGEPEGEPPPIPGFAAHRWVQGTSELAVPLPRAMENGLDWCHAVFTHRWTHGQFYATLLYGAVDQGIEVVRAPDRIEVRGPLGPDGAPVGLQTVLTARLPNRIEVETLGTPRRIVLHFVPLGPDRCRLEWMMSRIWPFGRRLVYRGETLVFRQDRVVLESLASGGERNVPADLPGLWLRRALAGDVPSEPERRTVRLRS